jgi:hypothetical protein
MQRRGTYEPSPPYKHDGMVPDRERVPHARYWRNPNREQRRPVARRGRNPRAHPTPACRTQCPQSLPAHARQGRRSCIPLSAVLEEDCRSRTTGTARTMRPARRLTSTGTGPAAYVDSQQCRHPRWCIRTQQHPQGSAPYPSIGTDSQTYVPSPSPSPLASRSPGHSPTIPQPRQ